MISLTLKGVRDLRFETAREMMVNLINMEAIRHAYLLESDRLMETEKETFAQLMDSRMSDGTLNNSILTLSRLLCKHYNHKVLILIDEYDVPLDKAYQNGYYNEMVNLIRNVFHQGLKINDSMQFAVLTGCLRVAKESIFTGLNNLRVLSITDVRFDEYFGFTDEEVMQMMDYYDRADLFEAAKTWYDGYWFGNVEVYCPWDVINYCDLLRADPEAEPQSYWINTSDNEIIRKLIQKGTKQTQKELEQLINGETIGKEIRQELTYNELDKTIDNIWSVMFTTGYLTQRGKISGNTYRLAIPNLEIRQIFVNQVMEWIQESVRKTPGKLDEFCEAFFRGDPQQAQELFNTWLMRTISIRDTNVQKPKKENFYHGVLLGLLSHRDDWWILSNAESGEGYSDILIEQEELETGIVIEVKYAENDELEKGCTEALEQIERMKYAERLREDGMKTVRKYGIACYKKHCMIVMG